MDANQINEAAQAHAKGVLGEEQYAVNKDAVESITGDFTAGVKWAIREPEPTIELLRTLVIQTGLGDLTVSHEDIAAHEDLTEYLRKNGHISESETDDDVTYWQGPVMTREEYKALAELN